MTYAPLGSLRADQIDAISTERRSNPRYRTDQRFGKILNRNRACLCECRIHDLSAGGARVVLANNVILPKMIFLFDALTQRYSGATVVWRKGTIVGLQFLPGTSF